MLWWLCLAARAADPDVDDGEDIDVPAERRAERRGDGFGLDRGPELDDSMEEDEAMVDFVAQEKRKAPPPTWFHLDPAGEKPLADNFDVQVVSFSEKYVVLQLPVVIAANRASFVVEHPNGLVVAAEIESGPHKVVQRQQFTSDGVLPDSPTIAFFEVALPFTAKSGSARFLLKVAEGPPPEDPKRKVPVVAPPLQDRFARTSVFTRP
jgi:hypothetical protein